jgi:homoserine O-succinyltransferase/O-acetyltransferase
MQAVKYLSQYTSRRMLSLKKFMFAPSMIRIAILDLYEGQANQGMRCLRQIIRDWGIAHGIKVQLDEFEVRQLEQLPDLSYDIYISSGGPGSPYDGEGTEWEKKYFSWINSVDDWNSAAEHNHKKFVFFICHSFELACRHFKLAFVTRRRSTAFGVFPVHLTDEAQAEHVFEGLPDPFYVVDSRDWQVIQPNLERMNELGASLLCVEKDRPHVPYERAVMGLRFNEYMIGTQFHPEADAEGMSMYLQTEEKKQTVIQNHGEEKWRSMIEHLNDPDKIMFTYSHVLPNFLNIALQQLHPQEV